jgi:hypothetical protein
VSRQEMGPAKLRNERVTGSPFDGSKAGGRGGGVKLTTHLHTPPRIRTCMCRAYLHFPIRLQQAGTFTFTFKTIPADL